MHATLLLAALLGPVSPLQRSCPAPSGFAAHLPQQMLRPLGAAYDPETLRVAYGIAAQLTVCPPNQVSTGTPCAVHRVYRPAAGEIVREPLVLFLPGSGMEPERHDFVLQAAAYAGFRTIGLSYDNTGTIESQCNGADCLDCFGQVRDEIITGDNRRLGGQTVVRRSDSIVERLNNLLRALYADDLADGVDDDHWRDFYFPVVIGPKHAIGSIRWENVIVAGFSQGAGHGARISQTVPVHGLVMLEGGDDTCGIAPGTPANWYSDPNASLGRPHYAVRHRRFDPAWTVPASWTMLDFPTVFDDFDDAVIALEPFLVGSTNQRTASMPPPETPNNACSDHEAMAKDGCMPTGVTNQATAASADDAYLFPMYLERFCYACDAATCP